MLQDDYILEQTEFITRFLKTVLFAGEDVELIIDNYSFTGEALDMQAALLHCIMEYDYNQAENILFDQLNEAPSMEYFRLSVWFYNRLLQIEPEQLEAHNFSGDEILEGLQEVEKMVMQQR